MDLKVRILISIFVRYQIVQSKSLTWIDHSVVHNCRRNGHQDNNGKENSKNREILLGQRNGNFIFRIE